MLSMAREGAGEYTNVVYVNCHEFTQLIFKTFFHEILKRRRASF